MTIPTFDQAIRTGFNILDEELPYGNHQMTPLDLGISHHLVHYRTREYEFNFDWWVKAGSDIAATFGDISIEDAAILRECGVDPNDVRRIR